MGADGHGSGVLGQTGSEMRCSGSLGQSAAWPTTAPGNMIGVEALALTVPSGGGQRAVEAGGSTGLRPWGQGVA